MNVGVYVHQEGVTQTTKMIAQAVALYLRKLGFTPTTHECLCDKPPGRLEELVFISPGNNPNCYAPVQESIRTNPHTQFFIFAPGNPHRQEAIGEHPNAQYITNPINRQLDALAASYLQPSTSHQRTRAREITDRH